VASTLAVEEIAAMLSFRDWQTMGTGPESVFPVSAVLVAALEHAHRAIIRASEKTKDLQGMGTALVLGCVVGNRLHTCHVGDVRAYVLNHSGLIQLTRDHSVVEAQMQAGILAPEAARNHPDRNQLLQALGASRQIIPEIHHHLLESGDLVLLCSDGLWNALSDAEMAAMLTAQTSLENRVGQVVAQANARGGEDNITALLYEHLGASPISKELAPLSLRGTLNP
jgi:protein phosphatase